MAISSALGSSALLPAGLGFRNLLMNGNMVIDQRNIGGTVAPNAGRTYTLDRWCSEFSQNARITIGQNYNSLTPPTGFSKYLGTKVTASYGLGSGDYFAIEQLVEGSTIAQLSWGTSGAKPVTLSFWVNSSVTGTFTAGLRNGSANRSYVFNYTINSANTWEYKTILIYGDSTGTWATDTSSGILLNFVLGGGSTYLTSTVGSWTAGNFIGSTTGANIVGTANATWNITGVQLEQNYQPTPFEQRPLSVEQLLCYRYFYKFVGDTSNYNSVASSGIATSGTQIGRTTTILPAPMRKSITTTDLSFGASSLIGYDGSAVVVLTSITCYGTARELSMDITTGSGLTTGRPAVVLTNPTYLTGLSVNAELS